MSLKDKAQELAGYLQVVKEKLSTLDKRNPATAAFLNVQEAHVLLSIGNQGAMTMSEIAQMLQLSLSSITTLIDKLEDKDFVRRERVEEDRRIVRVLLTPEGRKFHDLVAEAHLNLTVSLLKALDPDEQTQLLGLFRKISDRLKQPLRKR